MLICDATQHPRLSDIEQTGVDDFLPFYLEKFHFASRDLQMSPLCHEIAFVTE